MALRDERTRKRQGPLQRITRRRFIGYGSVGATTSFLLAACGGSSNNSSSNSNANSNAAPTRAAASTAGAATATRAAGTAAPAGSPAAVNVKPGGKMNFYTSSDPQSLDAQIGLTAGGYAWIDWVYNTLLTFDPTSGQLSPDLAAKWEQVDNLTYNLTLQPGAKFQNVDPVNGRVITADDVTYMVTRGLSDVSVWKYKFNAIASVQAVGSMVQLKMTAPFAPQLNYLADRQSVIVPHELVDKYGTPLKMAAVGSGPFIMKSYRPTIGAEFAKNPDYFAAGLPKLDSITSNVIQDRSRALAAFASGSEDYYSPVDATDFALAKSTAPTAQAIGVPDLGIRAARIRDDIAPFNDPRVRQALSMGLDRVAAGELLEGKSASQISGPLPPALTPWGFTVDELQKLPGYSTDKATEYADAKKLLSAAGQSSMKVTVLTTNATGIWLRWAQIIQDQWQRNLGITVDLDIQDLTSFGQKNNAAAFQVAAHAYADPVDPDQNLYSFLYTGDPRNWSHFSDPTMDNLLNQQRSQLDTNARLATMRQIQTLFLTQHFPYAVSHVGSVFYMFRPRVVGFVPNRLDGDFRHFVNVGVQS